jgi:transcriptional regulator with XRE-family HTH domain
MKPSEIIRDYRLKAGLTQKALAEKIGVHDRTIQKYESKEDDPNFIAIKDVKFSLVMRLCEVLKLNPTTLYKSTKEAE